jgi:hypothetical protein
MCEVNIFKYILFITIQDVSPNHLFASVGASVPDMEIYRYFFHNVQFDLGINYFTKINDALGSWQLCMTTMMPGRLLWKIIQNRNNKRSGTSSRYALCTSTLGLGF